MNCADVDLLILAATEGEAKQIEAQLAGARRLETGRKTLVQGTLGGRPCRLVYSGMGAVNAAHALTVHVERARPALVIQVGIGGAYVPAGLTVGAVAIATEEIYGDVGVITREGWLGADAIGIPLVAREQPLFNRFPLDLAIVRRAAEVCGATSGPFLTLARCTGIQTMGDELFARFGALCESMEGAAAAHVCALYDVPLLEIRAVSNLVEDRDRGKWRIGEAAARAQAAVLQVVEHLDAVLGTTTDEGRPIES